MKNILKGKKPGPAFDGVCIASIGTAVPPFSIDQAAAEAFLTKHYKDKLSKRSLSVLHTVFAHPSVGRRFIAVNSLDELINESADERIERFRKWAVGLSSQAVKRALSEAGVKLEMISGLVVNTCTGYLCPGLSTYLIEELDLPGNIKALDLVGSGCGGAIPNIITGSAILDPDTDKVTVCVSVEICTATFQMDDDLSLIVSNAIFSDGAAASVLWNRPGGLKIIDSANLYSPEHRDGIRYIYKNGQLHNQLSQKLPGIVSKAVSNVLDCLLPAHGLRADDIDHWAIHPGGDKVINAVKDGLGLSERQIKASRGILAGYGNMSSPTVCFILNEIMKGAVKKDELCLMLSFGAGLSVHALLLKKT